MTRVLGEKGFQPQFSTEGDTPSGEGVAEWKRSDETRFDPTPSLYWSSDLIPFFKKKTLPPSLPTLLLCPPMQFFRPFRLCVRQFVRVGSRYWRSLCHQMSTLGRRGVCVRHSPRMNASTRPPRLFGGHVRTGASQLKMVDPSSRQHVARSKTTQHDPVLQHAKPQPSSRHPEVNCELEGRHAVDGKSREEV